VDRVAFLDAGPLGLACNPARRRPDPDECRRWLADLADAGVRVVVPEIADYEVRRELIRAGHARALALLDGILDASTYAPLTTPIMRLAAELWAEARNVGQPTAPPGALDADVILAATVRVAAGGLDATEVLVATTDPGDLGRLGLDARSWRSIR
jgi:predicted nucleic acid-binding protein